MDRITHSEYERGWRDCFDKIYKHVSLDQFESDYAAFLQIYLDEIEEEFDKLCGI